MGVDYCVAKLTMSSIKKEPPDTFDVSNDLQRCVCMDDNPHICDTVSMNTSVNRPD